ncbi:MAG: hypothetical protein HY648_11120 [Acidobacteria bacterium]|nr:hypothetical protein [Acidobacteriota bacterium]
MNPWFINPVWQNFSSLCREVAAAHSSPNELSRFHHLTASLYFAVAAIEGFLNQQMRAHLGPRNSQGEIYQKLRRENFPDKLKSWPSEILGCQSMAPDEAVDQILAFNEIRGNLTHPKTSGHDIYKLLDTLNPDTVKLATAEYCIRFYETKKEAFPYWFFGWNYFNPRPYSQEILLLNNQQFLHSLRYLGFKVPAFDYPLAQAWQQNHMSTYDGYLRLHGAIDKLEFCEPKDARFPYRPTLCRLWWLPEHQSQCGNVTLEEIAQAQ